ncbi:hypothetical protein P7C70_g547, partial [Phenoliferia sp. Uapishka_3]
MADFSLNGNGTRFCEGLPILGLVAASIHGIAGNHDQAKRATARCIASTVTTAGGVAGGAAGFFMGWTSGAAAGAVAGAVTGTAVGGQLERAVVDTIEDEAVKRNATENACAIEITGTLAVVERMALRKPSPDSA